MFLVIYRYKSVVAKLMDTSDTTLHKKQINSPCLSFTFIIHRSHIHDTAWPGHPHNSNVP